MKFHQLTLYNVKNLRGTYFLDFDMHFGSEELFLIYGELGSGKTTIFDGISLALYGQTPQLQSSHTSKHNDAIRYILNTECEKCFSSLVFSFMGEEFYRATWHFQNLRNNKTISSPKRTLERLNSDFEVMETLCSTTVKKEFDLYFNKVLRGLSFSDFIRSVFLPQNQFTTFIREEPQKRTDILERITNTEVYAQISEQVDNMYDKSRKEVQKLEDTLKGLPSPDEVRGLKARAKALTVFLRFGDVQKSAIEKSKKWREQHTIKKRVEKELSTYNFRADKTRSELSDLEKQCVQKQEETKDISRKKNQHVLLLEENADMLEERKAHKEQLVLICAELDRVNKETKRHKRTLSAMPKGSIPQQQDVDQAEIKCQSEHDALIELLGEHTDDDGQPDMRIQSDLGSRYRVRLRFLDQRMQDTFNVEKEFEKRADHEKDLERYTKAISSIQIEIKKKEELQKEDKERVEKCTHRISALHTDILLYQTRLQPQSLRKKLKNGEPCSVCGAVEHPFHGDSMEEEERFAQRLRELQTEHKQTEEKLRQYRMRIQENSTEGIRLEERIRNGQEKREEKKKLIAMAKKICADGLQSLGIKKRVELESVHTHTKNYKMNLQEAFQEYEKSSQRYNKLLKERSKGVEREAQRERVQALLNQALKVYTAKEKEQVQVQEYLNERNKELCLVFSLKDSTEIDSQQVQKKYQLEQQYEKARASLNLLCQRRDQSKKIVQDLEREQNVYQEKYKSLLEEYLLSCQTVQDIVEILREGPEAMFPPDSSFEECVEICLDSERDIVYRILEWEKEQQDNAKLIRLYEQNKDEIKTLDTFKRQSQGWVELRNALNKGLKFREFAQGWQLQNLINRANVQLQQILKGYHLSPVKDEKGHPKLDFNVSKGGEAQRPITTLSGGESFSIALAFALALGNLRKVHMPIQTLLIDEGFGNLDHQSADMVVSGLESLKKKNIQVGLISHVQTLQERIAARISVKDLFIGPQKTIP